MALSDTNNGLVMPVSPMNGNGGFWGDGSFWIIILFLFAFMGNGWGGGYNGGMPVMNDVQRGFDQQAVMNGITGLNGTVSNGFANAEVSRCNSQANILQTLNSMATNMQNCCCENRLQAADLKYTIATEACSDRQAVTDALRDVIASNTANTQAILDKMCQQETEALKAQNADLQTRLNLANLAQSQTAQTAKILSDNAAQTQALEQYLNPVPIPAYVVQNPNCCGPSYYNGCGCNA